MSVEQLLPSDLPEVVAIENRSFAAPWTAATFREVFSHAYLSAIKWVEASAVRGYLVYRILPPTLEIMNIVVHPDHLRQGIARKMMDWALAKARSRGCTEAFLEVRVGNAAAIALYQSFGFSVIHTRKKYYRDGEDGLVMGVILRSDCSRRM